MKYGQQNSQYKTKRSVAETLIESLSQSGFRPMINQPTGRRRSRRGQAAGIFGMLLGLLAVGYVLLRTSNDPMGPLPEAQAPVALLEIVRGSVGALPAGAGSAPESLLALAPGEPIHAGTTIETGRGPGRAALRLAGGQSMRLDEDTRVRVASATGVTLERGAVYFDAKGGTGLEVRTTLGVVRDIGTQFEVRMLPGATAESSLRVRVREGAVMLEGEGEGESYHATVGEELTVAADGTLGRGTSPIHGPHWDWVVETAPAPNLVDQPLQEFLEWASREGGWAVYFADEETANIASQTVLHGDVQGLTLKDASRIVLDGSGLAYRLERGTLIVGPRDEPQAR